MPIFTPSYHFTFCRCHGDDPLPVSHEAAKAYMRDLSRRWRIYGVNDFQTFVAYEGDFMLKAEHMVSRCNVEISYLSELFLAAFPQLSAHFVFVWKRNAFGADFLSIPSRSHVILAGRYVFPTTSPLPHGAADVNHSLNMDVDLSFSQSFGIRRLADQLCAYLIDARPNPACIPVLVRDQIYRFVDLYAGQMGVGTFGFMDPPLHEPAERPPPPYIVTADLQHPQARRRSGRSTDSMPSLMSVSEDGQTDEEEPRTPEYPSSPITFASPMDLDDEAAPANRPGSPFPPSLRPYINRITQLRAGDTILGLPLVESPSPISTSGPSAANRPPTPFPHQIPIPNLRGGYEFLIPIRDGSRYRLVSNSQVN
ncbi:hypothetical protein SISNIDRAFT_487198 [Sistotremastrum niveocremeum HHB9708]|uniref:Uncharacterized protein n=1 Tax=Sistotremastrum niveocremeum HHB9708 TaxID=1314777 RepID=A0A164SX99_9AGAM|nr:hypothetical protein SISNIDRAFT_487198 [Sistotremastrum niveocremeum HHB9708]